MTPLSTRISGTVRKMKVDDLDSVKAGQVLVEIDDDEYRANVEEAKAALEEQPGRLSVRSELGIVVGTKGATEMRNGRDPTLALRCGLGLAAEA